MRAFRTVVLVALAVLVALPAAAGPAVPGFVEETALAGIDHSFTGDWEFIVGGGVAAFDCNDDLRPDLLLAGGTGPARLFRNESAPGGPLRFAAQDSGLEIASVAGTYPLDVDGDGITDVALLRVGENLLMRGLGGCRFEPANDAWSFDGGDAWSTAFAATWEAGTTWPTLAVGNYIDRTQEAFPWGSCTDNWLHRPGGPDRFAPPLPLAPSHCALSMLFTDWNRSGTPALRVSNDREYYKGGQEQLWHLEPGAAPRLYTEAEGWQRLQVWGMGIASHDLDRDGFPEYFLTSMADNKLQALRTPENGTPPRPEFDDIGFARGVIAQRPYTGDEIRPSTAWHAQFEDVNSDGLADLFIAKGNVSEMPDFALLDPNNLLLQRPDGNFEEAGDRAGVGSTRTARGAALADLNLDGRVDLVVVNRNAPAQIWRNAGTGAAENRLAIDLRQPGPNVAAIGAWIELRTAAGTQRHEVSVGGGHAGGSLGPKTFGLGEAVTAEVRAAWPDGSVSAWAPVAAGRLYRLSRDAAAPEVLARYP